MKTYHILWYTREANFQIVWCLYPSKCATIETNAIAIWWNMQCCTLTDRPNSLSDSRQLISCTCKIHSHIWVTGLRRIWLPFFDIWHEKKVHGTEKFSWLMEADAKQVWSVNTVRWRWGPALSWGAFWSNAYPLNKTVPHDWHFQSKVFLSVIYGFIARIILIAIKYLTEVLNSWETT